MWTLRCPDRARIRRHLDAQSELAFTYPEQGATRDARDGAVDVPAHYAVDHNRVRLGSGREVFERARAAVRRWAMFELPWVELCWPEAPIEVGTTVGILAKGRAPYVLSACRIVYTLDEPGEVSRYGFGYGTLPDHVEIGEERFCVELHRADDSVWYDLLAFSRPGQLFTRVAHRYARGVQRAFARGSKRAMVAACAAAGS